MFETTWDGSVAVVELDHGKVNAVGRAQLEALDLLCTALEEGQARALVTWSKKVSSRGTPIFVAGADVTERLGWTEAQVLDHVAFQRGVLTRVRRLPLFHITVVHGVALGWGTEFLITADYRLATPSASFALPETGLGIVPGAGGTSELWSVIGLPQAMRLAMTGERIDAAEALRIGLIQEVLADVHVGLDRALELAHRVARRRPTSAQDRHR
ncbi:MAG: enoyl-CoA hydratase/isomerase family protein [Myxococcota bacterium]